VKRAVQSKLGEIDFLEEVFDTVKQKIHMTSEQNIHRLLTELDTGGNIRYEEGKVSDNWYSS
jgi:hypothetical protein